MIPMAHPGLKSVRQTNEQTFMVFNFQGRQTKLSLGGLLNFSLQSVGNELHSVANPQNGNANFKNFLGNMGSAFGVNTGGPAGKNDALRIFLENLSDCRRVRKNFAVNLGFPDPPGDQLAVLGAKIKNEYRIVFQNHLRKIK